jgi:hypothetical protein
MGASNEKTDPQSQIPIFGGRIIEVVNTDLVEKMQPFTDFITAPSMQIIKEASEQIEVTIFSILDYSFRK